MQIDDINIGIIRALRDGRRSYRDIAAELGVTENTVRARAGKLQKEGILEITGLIDPEKLPGHRMVLMGVKLQGMNLVAKGEEFSRLRGVVSVRVVTGRFDLILDVMVKDDDGLLDFFTEQLDRVEGVLSVETFVVYKGYNVRMPYVLEQESGS